MLWGCPDREDPFSLPHSHGSGDDVPYYKPPRLRAPVDAYKYFSTRRLLQCRANRGNQKSKSR